MASGIKRSDIVIEFLRPNECCKSASDVHELIYTSVVTASLLQELQSFISRVLIGSTQKVHCFGNCTSYLLNCE